MRPAACTAPFSAGNASRGYFQDSVSAAALPLWARKDRRLSAPLSPPDRRTLLGAPHSDPSRDKPPASQPEASAHWASLAAIREATARTPPAIGREVPRADRRDPKAPVSVHRHR